MSAAVRAALAAKRAEHRSRSSSPTKKPSLQLPVTQGDENDATISDSNVLPHFGRDLDPSIASPFGSPKPLPKSLNPFSKSLSPLPGSSATDMPESSELNLHQKSDLNIIRRSVQNGKVNLSSRSPSLQDVPALLLSLLSDEPPRWFVDIPEDEREPWFSREELHTVQLGNNEIRQLPDKLAEFRGLKRLELHSNRITTLPSNFFQLSALTTLTLSNNGLTAFPPCLLALDNLVTLNLSNNKISTLWEDGEVELARSQQEAWQKQNAQEENGVWAGLSPSKKDRKPLPAETAKQVPMQALRTLDLSNNRISNAALGIPDLANRRNKAATTSDELRQVRLPTRLKKLDLGHNPIRGPVTTDIFTDLAELQDLGLQGCGIADDVFVANSQGDSASEAAKSAPALPSLNVLDLSGCEIDDLAALEALFGSRRIKSQDQALGRVEDHPDQGAASQQSSDSGMTDHQLVRVTTRPTQADIDKMEQIAGGRVLCLLLDGNPLREEAFRQKRGARQSAYPQKKVIDHLEATPPATMRANSSTLGQESEQSQGLSEQGIAPRSAMALPAKPAVVKEEWELLAEAGLNTELGRRKLRIEQARREQEAANAAVASGQSGTEGSGTEEGQSRGRKPRKAADGVSKANINGQTEIAVDASAQSGEESSSKERASSHHRAESIDDKDAGSALANAKLSTKKKEALGQVPCKFFRSNGCSAGASCPFAHTLPGDGGQKSVCQWFLKGSCRFGHKCALAHVLPGQPMSMDRKNKRAAQHGLPLPQMPNQQQQAQPQQSPAHGQNQATQQNQNLATNVAGSASSSTPAPAPSPLQPGQVKLSNLQRQVSQTQQTSQQQQQHGGQKSRDRVTSISGRDHDFPFGLPDDLHGAISPPVSGGIRSGFDSFAPTNAAGTPSSFRDSTAAAFAGPTSFTRPSAVLSQSHSGASLINPALSGMDSAAAAFGTSASGRAFGTSPFSHPGGHGLFFSGSQDSEGGAGPFSRSNRDIFGARSAGRIDDAAAQKWWSSLGSGASNNNGAKTMGMRGDVGGSSKEEEIEDAEDFLPSSLSDLLTPTELERRRRNNRLSSSMAGHMDERGGIAQSMPSHGPAFLSNGRIAIGAERLPSSGSASLLQQQRQDASAVGAGVGGGWGEGYKPFGEGRPSSGLDSIAFLEGSPAFSTSAGRTAIHHAPGQSLPQGLAAGLSRLHLRTGTDAAGASKSAAEKVGGVKIGANSGIGGQLGFGSAAGGLAGTQSPNQAALTSHSPVGFAPGSTSFSQTSSHAAMGTGPSLRVPGSLDDYGLGPTAPSSVLAHRSPLSLAVGSGAGRMSGSGSLSQSLSNHNNNLSSIAAGGAFGSPSASASTFSPTLPAIGSQRIGGGGGATAAGIGGEGIAIPQDGVSSKHIPGSSGSRYYPHHPGMQRLRAGSSAGPTPHSPLTLPVVTAEEDEDEAIFELE